MPSNLIRRPIPSPNKLRREISPEILETVLPRPRSSARVRRASNICAMEILETNSAAGSGNSPARRGGGFTTRKIACQQSLGECLAQRRAALSLTIEQVGKELNINPAYLTALEQGDHAHLPGTVYALAFLKSYARLLDLNIEETLVRYRSELKIYRHTRDEDAEPLQPVARVSWRNFLVPTSLARNAAIGLVLVVCLTYLVFKVQAIVNPPFLAVTSPADELLTDTPLLNVAGQVETGSKVTINGQEVLANAEGKFSTPFDLQPGVNLIRVTARKNHSNETVIIRRVVLQPAEP